MADIEATLQSLAQRFVRDLVRALVDAPIHEVVSLAGKGSPRAPAQTQTSSRVDKESGKSPKSTPPGRSNRASSKRVRRSSDEIETLTARVAAFVREGADDHPDGVAISEIAKALKVNIGALTRPMAVALQQGTIKKKGDRRMTRYFPGKKREA